VDLTVRVLDAAGAPIEGADVSATVVSTQSGGQSDAKGNYVPGALPSAPFQVAASHASYLPEVVNVIPPSGGGSFTWDNPVCSMSPPATLEIRLSRMQPAASYPISNVDLEKRDAFDPRAVFTWIDGGNQTNRYLAIFNGEQAQFVPVAHPLLPDTPGNGWDRISRGEPTKINPSQFGDLIWVEWGLGNTQDNDPRLLVALWVPRFRGPAPTKLDFVVFFSPNTAPERGYPADRFPWLDKYPYAAIKGGAVRQGGPPALGQPYPILGQRYLFHEKWLVYQMLAAQRQAVLVFPIQPSNDWGPFQFAEGLARLLAETTHFLHRSGHTEGGQTDTQPDQATSRTFRFYRNAIQRSLPALQHVVLAGFSAGVNPIAVLLGAAPQTSISDTRFPLFGTNSSAFFDAWMETWNHDAPAWVRAVLERNAPRWMQAPRRILRCYQTSYTGTPKNWVETSPLAQFVRDPAHEKTAPDGTYAAERHTDARCSCSLVYFDEAFLHHTAAAGTLMPRFWKTFCADGHQAVPVVTFGHAAALSGLTHL
jgi:hypothetical protein